jgi:hypothetical protein
MGVVVGRGGSNAAIGLKRPGRVNPPATCGGLRFRFLHPGGLHDVLRRVTGLPPLAGVVKLAAFSRAVERRHTAMDDRFSALDAAARSALLRAGCHGRPSADRGFMRRSTAPPQGGHGSGSGDELRAARKGHQIHTQATHRRHADSVSLSEAGDLRQRLKDRTSMQTCRLHARLETLLSLHFHRLFYLLACFVRRRFAPLHFTRCHFTRRFTPSAARDAATA